MSRSFTTRLLAPMLIVGTTLISTSVVAPQPASAAQPTEWLTGADDIWDVTSPDPNVRHTAMVRALVRDLVEYNGHMYAAGNFLEVKSPTGETFSQPYLARFDLETGVWDSSYRPTVDGMIYALELADDGRLYASGELSGGIALYDAASGVRDTTFDPKIRNSWGPPAVFDIELVGDELYAGGTFTRAQGVSLEDLARVDAVTGTIDPDWTPKTDFDLATPRSGGHNIFGLAVDHDRDRVYLAGKFGGINGDTDAAYFAILNTDDGTLRTDVPQGLPAGIPDHRLGFSMWMMDVQYRGDTVYVGGQGHQTMILDADTMAPRHTFFSNRGVGDTYSGGDTQVIFLGENTVWSGCHCWGSVGEYELGSYNNARNDQRQTFAEYKKWVQDFKLTNPFGQQAVGGGYGVDIETEALLPLSFAIRGQAGAYAIYEDSNGRVWFGGQYSSDVATGNTLEGIARFSTVDPDAGNGPTGLRSTRQTRERIVLTWEAANRAESYEILVGGIVVGTSENRWFTYQDLPAGTEYEFTVLGVFADGTLTDPSAVLSESTDGDIVGSDAPTDLESTRQTRERIVLHWSEAPNAASYEIVHDGAVVGTSNSRWFTHRDLSAGTSYTYTVRAVFVDGSTSDPSDEVSVSTNR